MLLNCGVGEDSWESLELQGIKLADPKGNQIWMFTGRTDAELEDPILWLPDAKGWLIRKDSDAGKDWRQEEKGTTEGEIVGWHHPFNRYESEQTLGDSEGKGSLVCCSPWSCKELVVTDWLHSNDKVNDPWGTPYWPLTLKAKQLCFIYPSSIYLRD